MTRRLIAARARRRLDRILLGYRRVEADRPERGWIRALRNALGMTAEQLAARLDVTQPSVQRLEASELNDTIRLGSLRRVAEAMDCVLVYAIVPRTSLKTVYRDQAMPLARRDLVAQGETFSDELDEDEQELLERYIAEELDPKRIWSEPVRPMRRPRRAD